jgi:hypothetical protein
MSKKNFKESPALAYIKPQVNTQEVAQEQTDDTTQENTQEVVQEQTDDTTQENTQEAGRKGYVKTQGRKGHKKPRINLAFDSEAFLDRIHIQSEREGKSITQFVNDAVAYYLERMNKGNRK